MVENLLAFCVAVFIVMTIWLYGFAKPNVIEKITLNKTVYTAGETMIVTTQSNKPRWAARFCTAQSSNLSTRSISSNRIETFEGLPVDFNDGSLSGTTEHIKAPQDIGGFRVTKRIIYQCGPASITVWTPADKYGWGMVVK
jgi:hypothetical protein